ncbi:MAG: Ig-like domain repeat protein, partial [Chloroflexi bacterium]|nr:Ig-like domain repeat protein [Chloroflexota bacterium]
ITATLSGGVRWVASRAPVDRPATPRDLRLATTSDMGASATDRITNETMVTMTGTGSPGSVIALSVNGVVSPYMGTVAPNGIFYVLAPVTSGVPEVTARAIGTTNLSSMKSATATFTVDITPPVPGTITAATVEGGKMITLAGASDTGHPGAGLATAQLQVANPILSAPWVVFQDIGLPVEPLSSGNASLPVPDAWSSFNQFRVSVTDVAGNIAFTAPLNVGTDNVAPTVGTLIWNPTALTATNSNQPTFAIAAVDVGNVNSVRLQIASQGGTFADLSTSRMSGTVPTLGETHVLQSAPLSDGKYRVRATVTDAAGNVAYTSPIDVTVDTVPPTVSEVQRQLIAESSSTWDAPRYTVTATDATAGIASVMLQVGTSASGTFTDSGSPVTQPYSGNIYVVPGPTVTGTQWVRMRVTDVAGNEATTRATMVTTWSGGSADSAWTTGGSASFGGGYLILTPNSGNKKGGAYYESLIPTTGQVSISFDLEVNGSADGVCVPFFSEPSAFLTGDAGGYLGCMGMTEGRYFVGISEYHGAIEIGTPMNGSYISTPASGFANTTSLVRFTIILTPQNGSTFIDVQAQVGSASPSRFASRTMTGTLPTAGTLVGITGATGGQTAEHKVRNIVISGS